MFQTTAPAVLLLAPNGLKVTLRPGKAQGNLWMLPPPTARNFSRPPLPVNPLTGIPTTCWRCRPHALATTWPILQLFGRHRHTRTADATPEQHQCPHTHFNLAPADMLATVTWQPNTPAEWRIHRGTFSTKHPAITYPVVAKHRSTTPEEYCCSRRVPETQTIEWTTYRPKTGVSAPIHTQLPHTRTRKEPQIRTDECSGDRGHPPRDRGLRRPRDQASHHHTLGDQGGGSACPHISTDVPVPPAPARQPEHGHICGCLWEYRPHTGGRWGSSGTTTRRHGPTAATPPDGDHDFWNLLTRSAQGM